MTHYIIESKFSTTSSSQVRIGTFNANGPSWKRDSLASLRELRAEGFGLVEIHTLQLEGSMRIALFHVFVCEAMPLPLPPLDP